MDEEGQSAVDIFISFFFLLKQKPLDEIASMVICISHLRGIC